MTEGSGSDSSLVRLYVERNTAERFESDAAAIVGRVGRLVGKAHLLSAVIEVGLKHAGDVVEALEAEGSAT